MSRERMPGRGPDLSNAPAVTSIESIEMAPVPCYGGCVVDGG